MSNAESQSVGKAAPADERAADLRSLVVWLGAIIIGAAGAWTQTRYGCSFFGRSGALLVVYGGLIGFLGARASLDYSAELYALQAEQIRIAELMHIEDHGAGPAKRHAARAVERSLTDMEARMQRITDASARVKKLSIVELPIVLIGTMIWGFGDLLAPNPACAL